MDSVEKCDEVLCCFEDEYIVGVGGCVGGGWGRGWGC